MKVTSTKKSLLMVLSLAATILFAGCPSSREGSGTGTGHGPANITRDTTAAGNRNMQMQRTDKTSTDSSGTGTGHKPQ
jgi:hypothetical protein